MADYPLNRRGFLRLLAGGTASAVLGLGHRPSAARATPTTSRAAPPETDDPRKSLVVRVHSPHVFGYAGLNRRILRDMITHGLNEMVGVNTLSLALKELFSKKETIGFKFNSSHARWLGTNGPLAEEILRLMWNAGYDPARLVFIETEVADRALPACGRTRFGWGKERDFGSGKDAFAAVLDQVDALVNVGLLKANAVAGMSGCLKNLTYGLIKHPARYHANACTPYIADIYRLPVLRNKVRFHLLSGLRILLRDEGTPSSDSLIEDRSLIFGQDVVAVDATGFEILDAYRKKRGLKPLIDEGDFPAQFMAAAHKGIGVYHPDQIHRKEVETE